MSTVRSYNCGMTIAGTIKMTAKQYLALGEDPPGVRLELVDGEIAVSPSPKPDHAFTVVQLASLLNAHIVGHDLGQLFTDVDTVFEEHEVRRPDLLFFRKDRLHLISKNEAFEASPDLAVEIISPGSVKMDRTNKFDLYRRHQVRHYWIVDPGRHDAQAFELVKGDYDLKTEGRGNDVVRFPPFPDLAIPLEKLWRPTLSSLAS